MSLGPLRATFTEGFDTADLTDAKALREGLRNHVDGPSLVCWVFGNLIQSVPNLS